MLTLGEQLGIELVPCADEHLSFVLDAFGAGLREVPPWTQPAVFLETDQLRSGIRSGKIACYVARLRREPDDLVGFIATRGEALLYLYVRYVTRKRGIGTWLLEMVRKGPLVPSAYWSRAAVRMAPRWGLVYDPFQALGGTS